MLSKKEERAQSKEENFRQKAEQVQSPSRWRNKAFGGTDSASAGSTEAQGKTVREKPTH